MEFSNPRQVFYQSSNNPLYPQPDNHDSRINALENRLDALQREVNSLQSQLTDLNGKVGGNTAQFCPSPTVFDPAYRTIQAKSEQDNIRKDVRQKIDFDHLQQTLNRRNGRF